MHPSLNHCAAYFEPKALVSLRCFAIFLKALCMTVPRIRLIAITLAASAVMPLVGCISPPKSAAASTAPAVATLAATAPVTAPVPAASSDQSISILEPADNATVGTTFMVRFGAKGLQVAPAGGVVPNSGHHHLLINLDSMPAGEYLPFSERHLHFGKGQTQVEVKLAPGVYKLTAQFGNGAHQSYGKPLSQTITVTVK
jgi:Domain of unknown function (DUF4399)